MRRLPIPLALALLAACSSSPKHADVSGGTGLGAPVEAVIDDVGMPHVIAQSEADAAFAMGYLHARDRFWELDLFRRQARGKVSELIGDIGRDTDVQMRTAFTMSAPVGGSFRVEDGTPPGSAPRCTSRALPRRREPLDRRSQGRAERRDAAGAHGRWR
jgi:hypothetical protein